MEKSTGLIVLGMHRSGTSALTGALHACGAYAGANGDLTGSNAENPKGFFERRDLRQICDALLHSADADWWKTSSFEIGKVGQNQLEQQRMAFANTVRVLSEQKTWIIKEPRLCLLLPLLIDLVPNAICLLIYRNPIEVAKSLRARNQISLQQGVSLWEKYNLSALEATQSVPCIKVSHHDLIEKPRETLNIIVNQLNALGTQGLNMESKYSGFIDKSLHRSIHDPKEMEILTNEQWHIWHFLEKKNAPTVDFVYQPSAGQKYVLQDLEYHFERKKKIYASAVFKSGRNFETLDVGIRSKKALKIGLLLDRIAFYIMSKIKKV